MRTATPAGRKGRRRSAPVARVPTIVINSARSIIGLSTRNTAPGSNRKWKNAWKPIRNLRKIRRVKTKRMKEVKLST